MSMMVMTCYFNEDDDDTLMACYVTCYFEKKMLKLPKIQVK